MDPATNMELTNEERARFLIAEANEYKGDDPIKIGIVTPITGPGDPTAGELICRGANIAAQYVREHGGIRGGRGIEFVLYNDQATAVEEGMARSSAAQMVKAALVDEVIAVIGQWQLRTTPWVVDVATRYNVPIFVENGHAFVTSQKRRNVFRAYFSVADRVPYMLDFAASQGWKRIAMLAGDTVFGQQVADALEEYAQTRHGMEFLRINFEQDGPRQFGEALATIKAYEPDLFINGGLIKTNYQIIKEATEIGLMPYTPTMVTFGFPLRSKDFWNFSGEAGLGMMWCATRYRPSWEGLTPIAHWFLDRYKERYGDFPPDTVLTHFTDVTIIAAALNEARAVTREDLLDALESMEFETWRGKIKYEHGPAHWNNVVPELGLLQYQEVGQSFDDSAIIWPPDVATKPYLPAPSPLSGGTTPAETAPVVPVQRIGAEAAAPAAPAASTAN
jgi:branched-chain amino acid transport system substrate-binding protein